MWTWRPIKSAPKAPLTKNGYGPKIIVLVGDTPWTAEWDRDFKKFYVYGEHNPMPRPKWWMPIPKLPEN